MPANTIIKLNSHPEGFGLVADQLEDELFNSSLPVQHTHSYYENDELGLYIGLWDTTDMTEAPAPYSCDEFLWLLQGQATIKNNTTGEVETAKAGEAFVIPKGYDCQWQQKGYLRKFYVISEHPDEAIPNPPSQEGIVIPHEDDLMIAFSRHQPFHCENNSSAHQSICYLDRTEKFIAGTWESDAFSSTTAPFPYHQFAVIKEGAITLTDDQGESHHFQSGDAFFIPEGVKCSAKVTAKVLLFFAVVKSQ